MLVTLASVEDLAEILDLQRLTYRSEAEVYDDFSLPPLTETLEDLRCQFSSKVVLKALDGDKIIGSVRAHEEDGTCYVGRLIVHPDFQGRGIGTQLMHHIESSFPLAQRFELFTGHQSTRAICLYRRLGYKVFKEEPVHDRLTLLFFEKTR